MNASQQLSDLDYVLPDAGNEDLTVGIPRWVTTQDESHARFPTVVRSTNHMRRVYQREMRLPYLTSLAALDLILERDPVMAEIDHIRHSLKVDPFEAIARFAAAQTMASENQRVAKGLSAGWLWRLNLLCAAHAICGASGADHYAQTDYWMAQRYRQQSTRSGRLDYVAPDPMAVYRQYGA